MAIRSVIEVLWVGGMFCHAGLAVVLLMKSAWKTFRYFTAYSVISFLSGVFIYAIRTRPHVYAYSYWLLEAIGILLGFAVVFEVFEHLFASHEALRKLASVIFATAVIVLFLIGAAVLMKHFPVGLRNFGSAVNVVEEAARVIEVGLLLCLFALSSAFGLHWKQQVFGVALGLGIFASVELIAATVRAQAGSAAYDVLNVIRISAFDISLLIWIGYLLAPERAASTTELPERSQLEQWNQAVMELIRQ